MMRQQAKVLTDSVDFLELSVNKLQNEVDEWVTILFISLILSRWHFFWIPGHSLVIDEQNLEAIAVQEGYNCQELTELVRENETILDGMKVSDQFYWVQMSVVFDV